MGRHDVWIELHEVVRPAPQIARLGDLIVHLVLGVWAQPERDQIELDVPALAMVWIKVDDAQHAVVAAALAVAEQGVVVGRVKVQRLVVL